MAGQKGVERLIVTLLKQGPPKQSSPAEFMIMPSIQNFILFLVLSDLNPVLTEY